MGVFAISVTTVLFPLLARSSEDGDAKDFEAYFYKGVRVIAAIAIPASVGLCLLAEPDHAAALQWKEFDYSRVVQGAKVLEVVAWTIPGLCGFFVFGESTSFTQRYEGTTSCSVG